jgi:formylglycine-generating enzyme required for sulfatase activity
VLRGASAPNAYIGYAPVTNAEYAAFKSGFTYEKGQDNYPVVNITMNDAKAYCKWLTAQDSKHIYRLPNEEEWILGAGHMPKDVAMNANHIESGLTAVDAYKQSTGACGGIDFWGNCWEWTTSTDANGQYIVKGGSWDSKRDDCRSEKSDDVRTGAQGYANVGFRIVRIDTSESM